MFAVVMTPKVHSITVPYSGKTWSPVQDHKISLKFEPNTFDVPEAICDIKVHIFIFVSTYHRFSIKPPPSCKAPSKRPPFQS